MATFSEIAEIVCHGSEEQKRQFSVACATYMDLKRRTDGVMRDLSVKCGWKGEGSLDFHKFYRFHVEHEADGIHFYNGSQDLCRFDIDAEGNAFAEGEWFPYEVSTDDVMNEIRKNCLSDENISHATAFSCGGFKLLDVMEHCNGHVVVKCSAWCTDEDVAKIENSLYGRGMVLPSSDYLSWCSRYFSDREGVHQDVARPTRMMYFYDGKVARSSTDHFSDENVASQMKELAAVDSALRSVMPVVYSVRDRLETAAGLSEGHEEMYSFASAVYPQLNANRGVSLVTNGGTVPVGDFVFTPDGIIYVETGSDMDFESEPKHFTDIREMSDFLEQRCLCDENIGLAHDDLVRAEVVKESLGKEELISQKL